MQEFLQRVCPTLDGAINTVWTLQVVQICCFKKKLAVKLGLFFQLNVEYITFENLDSLLARIICLIILTAKQLGKISFNLALSSNISNILNFKTQKMFYSRMCNLESSVSSKIELIAIHYFQFYFDISTEQERKSPAKSTFSKLSRSPWR